MVFVETSIYQKFLPQEIKKALDFFVQGFDPDGNQIQSANHLKTTYSWINQLIVDSETPDPSRFIHEYVTPIFADHNAKLLVNQAEA